MVAELSLDDGQRHAFVGDFDGVGVAGWCVGMPVKSPSAPVVSRISST
jgi:hypothetical protein